MKKLFSLTAALVAVALLIPSLSPAESEHQFANCQAEIHDYEIAATTADQICGGGFTAGQCAYARGVVAEKARAVQRCLASP